MRTSYKAASKVGKKKKKKVQKTKEAQVRLLPCARATALAVALVVVDVVSTAAVVVVVVEQVVAGICFRPRRWVELHPWVFRGGRGTTSLSAAGRLGAFREPLAVSGLLGG